MLNHASFSAPVRATPLIFMHTVSCCSGACQQTCLVRRGWDGARFSESTSRASASSVIPCLYHFLATRRDSTLSTTHLDISFSRFGLATSASYSRSWKSAHTVKEGRVLTQHARTGILPIQMACATTRRSTKDEDYIPAQHRTAQASPDTRVPFVPILRCGGACVLYRAAMSDSRTSAAPTFAIPIPVGLMYHPRWASGDSIYCDSARFIFTTAHIPPCQRESHLHCDPRHPHCTGFREFPAFIRLCGCELEQVPPTCIMLSPDSDFLLLTFSSSYGPPIILTIICRRVN
ncbi:hypothetical protein C8R45DRAFT_987560 [Mycena sanguinolenta]|nr:hypothetical protein C8R45DRAFT_987560 [Mycena sanguinolenta]